MSRYNSNNGGWFVLAAFVAVIAWVLISSKDGSSENVQNQLETLSDSVGQSLSDMYAFIEVQMNPNKQATACSGGQCFDPNINLDGFTIPAATERVPSGGGRLSDPVHLVMT